jgi:hypothetical protein
LKIHQGTLAPALDLLFAAHPKTCTLSQKQREEEDFVFHQTFLCFNLQVFQALKEKSNPKQTH